MRRNVAVCAILLAMGLGARTYFLTVKDGRICYREVPGSALVDTGRSVSMLPRAEDRAFIAGYILHRSGSFDACAGRFLFLTKLRAGRISS